MQLVKIKKDEFNIIYAEMEKNFCIEERRDYLDALALLDNDKYSIYHLLVDGNKVGFITVWSLSECNFIEHFVVYDNFRCLGYGSLALGLVKDLNSPIVLEVEHPETEIKKRRLEFYLRNGFSVCDFNYMQPSYHKDENFVPLYLLSTCAILNKQIVVDEIYETVYNDSIDN